MSFASLNGMKFRNLRIAWWAICGIAALLLCFIWARSYYRIDGFDHTSAHTMTRVTSLNGSVGITYLTIVSPPFAPGFRGSKYTTADARGSSASYNDPAGNPLPAFLGFKLDWRSAVAAGTVMSTGVFPYWSFVLVAAILATAPWLAWTSRFSLLTLLIATTLIAVVLGLIVWLR